MIDGAKMPPPDALPDPIKRLSNHQFYEIKVNAGSNSGIDVLFNLLKKKLDKNNGPDELREMLEKVVANKYKIIEQIGRGATTKVYLAQDLSLDRYVAIKASENPAYNAHFIETLRDAAKMVEYIPNSVQILGACVEKDPVHVIMSYLKGGTLRAKIEDTDGRGLPLTEAHELLLEIGEALLKALDAGITHCNVKPSNIILGSNNEPYLSPLCRLQKINIKFVLEKFSPKNRDPNESTYRENLCYLAPEIFDNDYAAKDRYQKIDQYMLGLSGYELLTGRIPHTVSTYNELESEGINAFKELEKVGAVRKECPGKLSDIIHKMISINPTDRYESLREAMDEIKQVSFDALEIAKDSYARCISQNKTDNEFFKVFYAELIRISPEAADRFKGKGIGEEKRHRQYDMLREAIFILLLFAEKKLGSTEPNVLTRIAEAHNKSHYDISGPTYNHFVKALTNTVCGSPPTVPEAFDSHCRTNENERDRIKKAWEEALLPGLEYMKGKYWESS
ncbi:MAG: serine/threonine-protein kinase [Chitinophagaceae bacterium]